MQILIAPNAFKNSLSAEQVALPVKKGLESSNLACVVKCFPVGDGGDGTAQLIIDRFNGSYIWVEVQDPLGRKINASFGLIDGGKTAVIESANASGIRLLKADETDPFKTSSVGTGELIRAALDRGVSKIIIGLGGSATVDGGAGMLSALGVRFIDGRGKILQGNPGSLSSLASVDISNIDSRISRCVITVLCDVDNQLLGKNGSAAVFSPQKGAKSSDIPVLESILEKIAELGLIETGRQMDRVKHGGAAGGIAAALYAFCDAELVAGAEQFLKITGFEESLKVCDLVITGEGSLDAQTLQGKAPFAVSQMAKKLGIPVVGISGRVPLNEQSELDQHFDIMVPIGHQPSGLNDAIKDAEANLIRTGKMLGNLISLTKNK